MLSFVYGDRFAVTTKGPTNTLQIRMNYNLMNTNYNRESIGFNRDKKEAATLASKPIHTGTKL